MKKIISSAFALSLLFVAFSCTPEFERDVKDVTVTSGNANFAKFVSLGNSLTSGYRDGALYVDGQNESYPSMIAQQMRLAGGGLFIQPLMPNNVGGFTNLFTASGGTDFYGKLTLSATLSPTPSAPGANLDALGGAGKYFNNMGVPGAKSFHLAAPGYGNAANLSAGAANPYFVRFATSSGTTVLADAMAQAPTFFSLWIGNNDVLSYATSGGTGVDRTGNIDPTTYGSSDISDPNVVAGSINAVLNGLKSVGATKGVIANIPNVTSIPYFTTVPGKPIAGLTSAQVTQLNAAYAAYNGGLAAAKNANLITTAEYNARLINFTAGVSNGAVIADKDLTSLSSLGLPSLRQTTTADLILLTALSVLRDPAVNGGTATPLADKYVLTEKETAKTLTAVAAYNAAISQLAATYGLALVDANSKMKELNTVSGITYNGVRYSTSFITGGAFSLDGVHPNGRGYAIIANTFISAINNKYGSTLPFVDVNSYSGITFPK